MAIFGRPRVVSANAKNTADWKALIRTTHGQHHLVLCRKNERVCGHDVLLTSTNEPSVHTDFFAADDLGITLFIVVDQFGEFL
jgi:hypothetical protein